MVKKAVKPKKEIESGRDKKTSDQILKSIQSKFGEGAIMKLGDAPRVDVQVVPTGSLGLDAALGVGGLPRGRIVEIYGPESSGKTTLTLHVIAVDGVWTLRRQLTSCRMCMRIESSSHIR